MNRRNATIIEDKEVETAEKRPQRVAVGMRQKLDLIGKDPNFAYRFVNDIPGRINDFKRGGWQHCTNEEVETTNYRSDEASATGSLAYVIVDSGTGMKSYAMKIRKDWFDAFQKEYDAEVDKTEEMLQPDTNDGGYGKLSIDRTGRR